MLFSSVEFVLFFLPVTIIIHFLLPKEGSARNYWLLLASLFFYAWGEPKFVIVMVFSVVFNYLSAIGIEGSKRNSYKKTIMGLNITINLGILFIFKYLNFFTDTLNRLQPKTSELFLPTHIALPIGISFFTFQALSYVIDVYRGIPAQKRLGNLGLYISFFPQLIAGPIVRYKTIMSQIEQRTITWNSFSSGLIRFCIGFEKKILLANVLAEIADNAFSMNDNSVCMAWLGVICYTLQIYFDFSGYSDMAIGLGRMFGFEFLENFNYPYISQTVTEFWRRWHISLGSWFRDYVYFPMGGSRVDKRRKLIRNLLVVWMLTGIWHGANWTFIIWGVMYGFIIIAEKITNMPYKVANWRTLPALGYRLFTVFTIMLGWMLFRSDSVFQAIQYLQNMLGLGDTTFIDGKFIFFLREYIVYIGAGVVFSMPIGTRLRALINNVNRETGAIAESAGYILVLALFVISFSSLVMNAHNPFIYFNF